MGSICLSTASILRCDSLTRNQNIYMIIPTALEVIFSTSLLFIDQGPGRRNLLLTAEGLSFLTLAVLELVSQILPAVRENRHSFNAFDLAIGIASFLPIALYTIFLCLLTNAEIITDSVLPRRIKNLTTLVSIFFIIVIITFNEIAAFSGFSTQNIKIPTDKLPESIFTIGPSGLFQQFIWTLSTTLTLAFLTCFQIIVFCFAFFRLTQAISSRRRIESNHSAKAQLIKGIGWISGSLMLGGAETVIGFAVGGFGVVLSRRILRLMTRASLCIGVIKGVDDFHVRSQFHEIISNPRIASFRRLSPNARFFHASSFHVAQRASELPEGSATHNTTRGLPDMEHFANVRAENSHQRVAVRYHKGTPLLHLRFSTLDMPSPGTFVEDIKLRPQSEWVSPKPSYHQPLNNVFRYSSDSASSFFAPFELVSAPRRTLSQRSARAKLYQAALPATSGESLTPNPDSTTSVAEPWDVSRVQSVKSLPESLQAVRDLAGQFPGPPVSFKDEYPMRSTEALPIPQALGIPSEVQSKGTSSHKGFALSDDSAQNSNLSPPVALSDNKRVRSSRQPTLYNVTPLRTASLVRASEKKHFDAFNDDSEEDSHSSSRTIIVKTISRTVSRLPDTEAGTGNLATALNTGKSSRQPPRRRPRSMRPVSKRDIPLYKVRSIVEDPGKSTSSLPIRISPTGRDNVQFEDIVIPPQRLNMPEILDQDAEVT